jgi:hypothetical protein
MDTDYLGPDNCLPVSKYTDKPIPAVAESADFGPAYNGESFVTLTFRVPKDTPALAGIFDLIPRRPGTFDWAKAKDEAR